MIDALLDLLALAVWIGTIGLVVWWVWSMRKASRPRRRTAREEIELQSLRAALQREPHDQRGPGVPPRR